MYLNDPDPYYVYFSYEEDGLGYIGIRKHDKAGKSPLEDDYFGSYSLEGFNPINKVILYENLSVEKALEHEVKLHAAFKVNSNPAFANKALQKSDKFFYVACGENNYQYNMGTKHDFYHPSYGVIKQVTCSYMRHKYNLVTSSLLLLSKNKIKSHLGWILFGNAVPATALKHYRYNWKSPNGSVALTPLEIAKQHRLEISVLTEVVKGKRKSYRGWSITSCQLAA